MIADALFNYIDAHGTRLELACPRDSTLRKRNEDGYVDNTSLGVDGRDRNIMGRLTTVAQRQERTLYATGGKLALHKCTWVLINWAWAEGEATLTQFDDSKQCEPEKTSLAAK